jgi:hypothetical protein
MIEPEMVVEEIEIILKTGVCPRCAGTVEFEIEDENDWSARCSNCKTNWGGFGGF